MCFPSKLRILGSTGCGLHQIRDKMFTTEDSKGTLEITTRRACLGGGVGNGGRICRYKFISEWKPRPEIRLKQNC